MPPSRLDSTSPRTREPYRRERAVEDDHRSRSRTRSFHDGSWTQRDSTTQGTIFQTDRPAILPGSPTRSQKQSWGHPAASARVDCGFSIAGSAWFGDRRRQRARNPSPQPGKKCGDPGAIRTRVRSQTNRLAPVGLLHSRPPTRRPLPPSFGGWWTSAVTSRDCLGTQWCGCGHSPPYRDIWRHSAL